MADDQFNRSGFGDLGNWFGDDLVEEKKVCLNFNIDMKNYFLLLLFGLIPFIGFSQNKNSFDEVHFEKFEIFLDGKLAYKYSIDETNYFEIKNLKGENIITGKITSLGNKKFKSEINFLTVNRNFTNEKIIGRNDIILNLNSHKVIKKNFELDEMRLNEFIDNFNQSTEIEIN